MGMGGIKDVSYQLGQDLDSISSSSPSPGPSLIVRLVVHFLEILAWGFGFIRDLLFRTLSMVFDMHMVDQARGFVPRPRISFPELEITDGPSITITSDERDPDNPGPFANDVYSCTYRKRYRDGFVGVRVWRRCSREGYTWELKTFIRSLERKLIIWRDLSHPSQHPNIDPLFGMMYCSEGYLPAMVTPYYHNGDINRYILRHPEVDRLKLLEGVSAGLRYMHSRNPPVAHGDVRGCNILITDTGTPVLSNIGLGQLPTPLDWTVGIEESLRWTAPEVMNPGSGPDSDFQSDEYNTYPTTPMSDVYSLGMLMLEIYTGKAPYSHRRFHGGVILDILRGVKPPRPTEETCPALTDEIWDVIQSCWEQVPENRPTMEVVGSWLKLIERVGQAKTKMVLAGDVQAA